MKIVAVAARKGGVVVSAGERGRHYQVLRGLDGAGADPLEWEQGFLSSTGRFLDRREALEVAIASGQVTTPRNPRELFSEDLW